MNIEYFIGRDISADEYIELLKNTTLGLRRPIDDKNRIYKILANSNIIVSAWNEDKLIGVARCVSDFSFCCYLSDLAVHEKYQKNSVGKNLIRNLFSVLDIGCKVILLAAPSATTYYPKIGFKEHNSAWIMDCVDELVF